MICTVGVAVSTIPSGEEYQDEEELHDLNTEKRHLPADDITWSSVFTLETGTGSDHQMSLSNKTKHRAGPYLALKAQG